MNQLEAISWLICMQKGLTDDEAREIWTRLQDQPAVNILTQTLFEIEFFMDEKTDRTLA